MTALNDAERVAAAARTAPRDRDLPVPAPGTQLSRFYPAWLPSYRFIAAVVAIGGMQLLATMDSTVAIVALPKIQDELSLSDAGRSWVITAYVLTFGGLMLLGGRLGDTIGRKRTFIVGVALFTIASVLCGVAMDLFGPHGFPTVLFVVFVAFIAVQAVRSYRQQGRVAA